MKKYLAEMVGTMVLVLMGCGSAVFAGNIAAACGAGVGTLGVAMAFGLSVIAMAYTIGGISGCHINPAITLGVWLSKRMNGKDAAMYMVFQIIGAIIGSSIIYALVSTGGSSGVTTTEPIVSETEKCYRHSSPRQSLRLFLYWWYWVQPMRKKERAISQDWLSVLLWCWFILFVSLLREHR